MIYFNPFYIYNVVYEGLVSLFTFSVVTVFMAKVIWFAIGAICLGLIIIIRRKKAVLLKAEAEALAVAMRERQSAVDVPESERRWEKIMGYLGSVNPSDWKLAILEADTILDSLVQRMGYKGENLGERLKSVEPSDFLTLNDAWEAHKVRNAIAHEAGYELSQREARRVMRLFENVFKEFEYL